jgi:hypothetical protein
MQKHTNLDNEIDGPFVDHWSIRFLEKAMIPVIVLALIAIFWEPDVEAIGSFIHSAFFN